MENVFSDLYKCGYCGFLIKSHCENLLEHDCLKNIYVEGDHDLVEDGNKVLTVVSKEQAEVVGQATTGEAFEELLIKYVQYRPALYNTKLPLSQRIQSKKTASWLEIFNLFGGKISLEDLQKKWKYLRDRYNKAKKRVTEYRPSGSQAGIPPDPGFSYYQLMRFLDDGSSHQETISSVAVATSKPVSVPLFSPATTSSCLTTPEESPQLMSPSLSEGVHSTSAIDQGRSIKKKKEEPKNLIEKEVVSMLTQTNGWSGWLPFASGGKSKEVALQGKIQSRNGDYEINLRH